MKQLNDRNKTRLERTKTTLVQSQVLTQTFEKIYYEHIAVYSISSEF